MEVICLRLPLCPLSRPFPYSPVFGKGWQLSVMTPKAKVVWWAKTIICLPIATRLVLTNRCQHILSSLGYSAPPLKTDGVLLESARSCVHIRTHHIQALLKAFACKRHIWGGSVDKLWPFQKNSYSVLEAGKHNSEIFKEYCYPKSLNMEWTSKNLAGIH